MSGEVERNPRDWTIRVLTAGTMLAVGLFVVGFVLNVADQPAAGDAVSTAAVVALLMTPTSALVATAVELRQRQRSAAFLALVVLAILAVATVVALLSSR